jgi:hypothetical protein
LRRHEETTEPVLPGSDGPAAARLIRIAETALNYDSDDRWEKKTPVPPSRAESLLMYCQEIVHQTTRGIVPHVKFGFENAIGQMEKMPGSHADELVAYDHEGRHPGMRCIIRGSLDLSIYADIGRKAIVVIENGEMKELQAGTLGAYYRMTNGLHETLMKAAEAMLMPA